MQDDDDAHPRDRRDAILGQATDAFLTHGYAGTSMADLARAIGIQKASFYHHFPSKEALFVACVTEGFDGASRRLEAIRQDPALTDRGRIVAALEEIYRISLETPVGRMCPLIAEVATSIPDVARLFHTGFISRMNAIVEGIVADGIARGSFAGVDPVGVQRMMVGPAITLSLLREMTAGFTDPDTLYPLEQSRQGHIALVLRLLTPEKA